MSSTSGSTSVTIKQIVGCANGVSWFRRDEINQSDLSTQSTIYINSATGAVQAVAPAGFVAVACEVGKDASFTVHCDTSTTPPTPYIKRVIVDFSTTPPTQSFLNYTLAGAAFTPVTESVCDGYALTDNCVDLIDTASGVITPVRSIQMARYGVLIGAPIFYALTTNAVVTLTGTQRPVNCGSYNYTESLLCDSSNPPVPFWLIQIKVGATALYAGNLRVDKQGSYGPTGAVSACQNYSVDDEYVCIAGAAPNDDTISVRVTRVFNGATLVSEVRTRVDTYAVVANNVPLVPCTQVAEVLTPGSSLVVGTNSFTTLPNSRSYTLLVNSGSVTVSGAAHTGAAGIYQAGTSISWSRDNAGEVLAPTRFTGVTAGTRFSVSWTV